jgi:hypothetical protein
VGPGTSCAVLSRGAYRNFGASCSFFARCGIPQASPSSLLRSPQLRTGAPCSHQRTWAENDGRSPPQLSVPDLTRGSLGPKQRPRDQQPQVPPLRSCGALVGMTRGGRLLFESVATWMDGVQSSYSAKTADPSTTLLRSSGRDDKGRAVTLRKYGDLDGWSSKQLLRKNCRSLHYAPTELRSGRQGEGGYFSKYGDLDGRNLERLLRSNCRSLHYAPAELRSG